MTKIEPQAILKEQLKPPQKTGKIMLVYSFMILSHATTVWYSEETHEVVNSIFLP